MLLILLFLTHCFRFCRTVYGTNSKKQKLRKYSHNVACHEFYPSPNIMRVMKFINVISGIKKGLFFAAIAEWVLCCFVLTNVYVVWSSSLLTTILSFEKQCSSLVWFCVFPVLDKENPQEPVDRGVDEPGHSKRWIGLNVIFWCTYLASCTVYYPDQQNTTTQGVPGGMYQTSGECSLC